MTLPSSGSRRRDAAREEYVRMIVDARPPLTAEQRTRLNELLHLDRWLR